MKRASRLPQWPPRLPGMLAWLRWRMISKLLLAVLTASILTALIFLHLDYYQVGSVLEQLRPEQPAPREIIATDTVTWDDIKETERLKENAASQVSTVFTPARQPLVTALDNLDRVFQLFDATTLTAANLDELRQIKVPHDITEAVHQLSPEQRKLLHATAQGILNATMGSRIEEGRDESQALAHADALARVRVPDPAQAQIVSTLIRVVFRPTWIEDTTLTARRKDEARHAVPMQTRLLRRGEVLFQKGEIITAADLEQLKAKHLLTSAPLTRLLPIAGLMLFAVCSLGIYLRSYCAPVYNNPRKLALLACLVIAPLWVNMTLGDGKSEYLVGLMAIAAGNMAIAGLLGIPVATVTTLMTSTAAGLTADHPFTLVLLALCSSLAGIMAVPAIWPARRLVNAVLALVLIDFLLLLSLEGISPGGGFPSMWNDLGRMALWSSAAGIGACIIAVGAIYMLARPFGITTHYRLMELSNSNEPLLRRMMTEAPGTYHSSIMVANLAESAADAIGANALLTRIAALYHDIGKLKRPAFFIENQAPLGIENVHQRLSPRLSYFILTSHVRDGVEFGKQYKLPEEIITIIHEHHGTTLAAYFYHRALNEPGHAQVSELDYRYPGPKPSSREAAIVMLSDSVQASVKALKEPTPTRIENMVNEIINNRLNDGQLEDCDITLRNLRCITDVFVRVLSGLYSYSRIEYPELKVEGTRIRANINSESASASNETAMLTRGS